jgi:signal transduction histidine kinase
VFLYKDVIVPAIKYARQLLDELDIKEDQIKYYKAINLPVMYVDKLRFRQVIFNLLSNAIKFMKPNNPRSFFVEIEGKAIGGGAQLIVRDNGIGISKETKESIFREGVRGRRARKLHIEGQGIGLWIVRQIVEAHGGTVVVTSTSDPTEITITLPSFLQMPKTV